MKVKANEESKLIDLDEVIQVQEPIVSEHVIAFDVELSFTNVYSNVRAIFILHDNGSWNFTFKDTLNDELLDAIYKSLNTIKTRIALQVLEPKAKSKEEILKEFMNQNVSFSMLNYGSIEKMYLDIARLLPPGYEYKCVECTAESGDALADLQHFEKSLPSWLKLKTRLAMLGLLFNDLCEVQVVAHLDNIKKVLSKYAYH